MTMIQKLIKQVRFAGGKYKCIVCGKKIRTYFKFSDSLIANAKSNGFPYNFERMETLNFQHCNCPFCLSMDRERLYLMYLEQYVFQKALHHRFAMLDFAPNTTFYNYLKKKDIEYVSADFFRDDFDLKLDICNMATVANNRYDFVICSHILEHVPSPKQALQEMYRILKKGGQAIIMVPLFWDVKETTESLEPLTPEEKCKYFGQDDHVRLFEKQDFLNNIKSVGFNIIEYTIKDFDVNQVNQNAISKNSILYIAQKI